MSTSELPANATFGRRENAGARVLAAVKRVPAEVWMVTALTLLAAAIRFATIASQSYWTDEALTAYESHLSFGKMINTVVHVETTPPLYFVLAWGWSKIFGYGEAGLRSLSALAGIAVVPLLYLSGRELVSRRAGVLGAALAVVNPYLIWYSQEARSYILLVALSTASLLWFLRAVRKPSRRHVLWWAGCSGAALTTHFFAGFLIAPEALWLLWTARTRTVGAAVASVAVVQIIMLPFALIDTGHGPGWIHVIRLGDRIGQIPLQFGFGSLYRRVGIAQGLIGGAILLAVVVLLLALRGDERTRRGAKLAGALAAAAILVPLVLGLVGPDYFLARNVIPAWAPLACVIAAACVAPRARIVGGVLAAVLLVTFSVESLRIQNSDSLQRPNWRSVARVIGPANVPRAILAAGGDKANALKVYLPHVSWVQSHRLPAVIDEVVVVGTVARISLVTQGSTSTAGNGGAGSASSIGVARPRLGSVPGARKLGQVTVNGWTLARFALLGPWRVNIDQLTAAAPRFFHLAPTSLLAFVQRPGN